MRDDSELMDAVGRRVASAVGTGPSDERRRSQREALAMLAGRRRPRRGLPSFAVPLAAGLAAVALVGAYLLLRGGSTTPTDRAAATAADGDWIEVPRGATRTLDFPDGSRVEGLGGSLLRVVRPAADRVAVLLRLGEVRVEVEKSAGRRWSVEAGPYTVTVTGTIFSVWWEPGAERLDVAVRRGEVLVEGPGLATTGTRLAAGQRLRMGEPERTAAAIPRAAPEAQAATRAEERATVVERAEPPPEAAAAETEPMAEPAAEPAERRTPRATATPLWKERAAAGDYRAAADAAEAAGIDGLRESLGEADLWELATALRYARRGPDAAAALESYRRRFPRAGNAATAAFLLGRVEAELTGRPVEAARWFRTYLDDGAAGALAEEARGRLIETLVAAGDRAGAREAAAAYLERHAGGTFADLAASVLAR